MKSAKIFIIFTFISVFGICVSAQDKMPNIVWKNLQEKYERFEDVKPVVVNESDKAVFMFADTGIGIVYDYLKLQRYSEVSQIWLEVVSMEHVPDKKYLEKIMSNFKMEPQQIRPIVFDNENWLLLTESDGTLPLSSFRGNPNHKGKGRYRFTLQFYVIEKKSRIIFTSKSPIFEITKEQKSFFDK